ncbi:Protein phosphatase 2C 2 [Rhodotorula sphaerocarpa]
MEDAHSAVLSLGEESVEGKPPAFFAVYDGHGGSTVAKFAGDTVHSRLASNDHFKKRNWEASLKRAYLETDEDLRANPDFKGDPSGCTAVSTIITPEMNIVCANAGDSRAVMSVGGEAKPLSFDHKPTNEGETSRIVAAGGFVEFGRVNGNLALSRALGDFDFKQSENLDPESQIVTADPDITVHEATPEDEFVVIACDGIWDVLTSQQVIDFVRLAISQGKSLQTVCEEMLDRCLAPDSDWGGVGCDNMTMMVVALLGERSEEEWYAWVKQRVENGEGYPTPKEYVEPFGQGGNGPRGALMAGGSGGAGIGADGAGSEAAPGGILGGALRVGSLADGTVQLSFGGADGADGPEGHGLDDDSEDDAELDLPTIQAALRARMAELEAAEGQVSGGGTGTISEVGAHDEDDEEDDAMIEDADADASAAAGASATPAAAAAGGEQAGGAEQAQAELDPHKLRTSHSPPEVVR